jgi:hypothetical protein
VAIIDLKEGAIAGRLTIGRAPYALALDTVRHILYATTPGDKSVWVIHLDGDKRTQRIAVPGLGLALGLTLDDQGTAYLVYTVSPKTRAIARLTLGDDDSDNATLVDIMQGDYNTPLADATGIVARAGSVYVTEGDRLIAVDAATGKAYQSLDIGVTAGSFGIAIEQETGAAIVGDTIGRGVKIVN